MRRASVLLILTLSSALAAEPFHVLLIRYARAYRDFDRDIRIVADSVRTRSGVQFDYGRLYAALEVTGRLVPASAPELAVAMKAVSTSGSFLDSDQFKAALGDLDDLSQDLADTAGSAWAPQGLLIPTQSEPIHSYTDLASYGRWNLVQLDLKELEIQKSVEDFEIRYGPRSDRVNLLELLLINYVPPFQGSTKGPSHWEPILRITPVCYSVNENRFIKTVQIGFNYYFLSGSPSFLRWVHHVGFAPTVADVTGDRIYRIGKLGWGGTLHLGRYQVGAVYVPSAARVNVFSTIDFQLIPTLF